MTDPFESSEERPTPSGGEEPAGEAVEPENEVTQTEPLEEPGAPVLEEPAPVPVLEEPGAPVLEEPAPVPALEEPKPEEPAPAPVLGETEPAPAASDADAVAEPDGLEPEVVSLEEGPADAVPAPPDESLQEPISAEEFWGKAPAAAEEQVSLEPAPEEAPAEPAAAEDVEAMLAAEVEEALEGVEEDEARGEWFVVHTYAGYENKVKANLETRVHSMNMEESIFEVVIPMEKVVEVKGGKKQTVDRKVFPGYLLVRMDLNDDSWYVVRNTPGVTGFVAGSGNKPIPLSPREVDKILARKGAAEAPRPKPEWQPNEPVRVTTGPFANFQGVVSDIDIERSKLKVLVNIFGRETPVELGFDQVAKV